MSAERINYEEKEGLRPKNIHKNQWWDTDANNVKSAINAHADLLDGVTVIENPLKADSFVKTGGTIDDILLADGTVITKGDLNKILKIKELVGVDIVGGGGGSYFNLSEDNTWVVGGYIDPSGNIIPFANFAYSSNFIAISPNEIYSMWTTGFAVAWYDAGQVFISLDGGAVDPSDFRSFTSPTNASFMRLNQVIPAQEPIHNYTNLYVIEGSAVDPGFPGDRIQIPTLDLLKEQVEGVFDIIPTNDIIANVTFREIADTFDFSTAKIQGNVIVSGDSTIAAYLGGVAISTIIQATGTITDIAVPGHTIAQQQTAYTALSGAIKTGANYVFIQIGLNDLAPQTPSYVQTIQAYQSYITSVKTNSPNAILILGSMLPCKLRLENLYGFLGTASLNKWKTLNYMIENGAIMNCENYTNLHVYHLSDGDDNLDPIYDTGDGIHPNTSGRKLIAYSWISRLLKNSNKNLYNFYEVTTQTLYSSSTDLELTDMAQTITTLKDNQRVIIRIMLNYECNHEGTFYIKIDGVEVGSAISGGRRGIASCSYDVDNDSTMMNTYIQYSYIESVAGTKPFTLNRRGVSASVALNRTIRNSANDETATSSIEIELKP